RASPVGAMKPPSGPRTQGPLPPRPSGGSLKAASRTCAPRGVPPAGRRVAARSHGSHRGARRRLAPSLHARRQESSEHHPSRSWCNLAPLSAPSKIYAARVHRFAGSISHHRCACLRTQHLTLAGPFRGSDTTKGKVMGKLEGKVAVITGGSSGMALSSARRFVEEGAYVFITGRRQETLDEAVRLIGRNVTGVRGDAANLSDLDRLFATVKREKGRIDVLYASAGKAKPAILGQITEQHFDKEFGLIVRGTLFAAQKALPLLNDGGSIVMTGSVASVKGFPGFSVYAASKAALRSFARTWLNELKGRKIRVNVLSPGRSTHQTPSGSTRQRGRCSSR